MIDQRKRVYQPETQSLLALKRILTEAKRESPPQTWQAQSDANEELALKLIARMKKEYRKSMSLRGAFVATKQSPPYLGIASGYCPRNDMKVEP